MLNLPFLEKASVQFEPFVISASAKMSPRTSKQTLTEGSTRQHQRYRHMTFRITQVFPSYLERRQCLGMTLAWGSRSSFAWQRRLPEEKMESKLHRNWGSCARGDVFTHRLSGYRETSLRQRIFCVFWTGSDDAGASCLKGRKQFGRISMFVWDYWGRKQTPARWDVSTTHLPHCPQVTVNHLLWLALGVNSRKCLGWGNNTWPERLRHAESASTALSLILIQWEKRQNSHLSPVSSRSKSSLKITLLSIFSTSFSIQLIVQCHYPCSTYD